VSQDSLSTYETGDRKKENSKKPTDFSVWKGGLRTILPGEKEVKGNTPTIQKKENGQGRLKKNQKKNSKSAGTRGKKKGKNFGGIRSLEGSWRETIFRNTQGKDTPGNTGAAVWGLAEKDTTEEKYQKGTTKAAQWERSERAKTKKKTSAAKKG